MIQYRIDFDGDWPLWQRLCHEFYRDNDYFILEEMPGWVRATQHIQDIRLFKDEYHRWATVYFEREEDLTAFLLKWA